MSFELTTLGEYAKVQGGFAYKSKDFSESGKCPVLKIKNVRFGTVDYSEASLISEDIANETTEWKTKEGDILISMTGSGPNAPQSLVGRVARVWGGEPEAWINQRVGRVVIKNEGSIHPDFLFYILSSARSQEYLVSNSSGSANQANISGKTIESLPCPKVNFEESAEISKILLELDKKVILNRQTNQTLEAIAQAIFKSWFVDFDPTRAKIAANECAQARTNGASTEELIAQLLEDGRWTKNQAQTIAQGDPELAAMSAISGQFISAAANKGHETHEQNPQLTPEKLEELRQTAALFPSALVDSELGEIPEGWEVGTLGDLCELNKSSWTKKNEPDDIWYVDLANTKNGVIESIQRFKWSDAPSRAKRKLKKGDAIIGTVRPGNRSFSLIGNEETILTASTGFAVLTPLRTEFTEFVYVAATTEESIARLAHLADGGAYPAVRPDVVTAMELIVPNSRILVSYSSYTQHLFDAVHHNYTFSNTLKTLRDNLLPQLLSGELELDLGEPS